MVDFVEVYDNVLTTDQCCSIIEYTDTKDKIPGTPLIKNSLEVPDNYFSNQSVVDKILSTTLLNYVKEYKDKHPQIDMIDRWGLDDLYNLQRYDIGKGYDYLHCENGCVELVKRVLVWMIYLNTVNGGTYFDNYDRTIEAVQGRLVLWPASWTHTHRGIISKTEVKYITTGWFSLM